MLAEHRNTFFGIANDESCWIGLRDPNPLADKWIPATEPKCYPKPMTCKAKTSDVPGKPWGGLVVSPLILPDHFTHGRLPKAIACWEEFQPLVKSTEDPDPKYRGDRFPNRTTTAKPTTAAEFAQQAKQANRDACGTGNDPVAEYRLITDGPRKGVVLYHGAPIFADYDVFALVSADEQGRMVSGLSPTMNPAKYWKIVNALNKAFMFNVDMVQHEADFDWTRGTATAKGDCVLWFGPKNKETLNPETDGQFSVTRIESARMSGARSGNARNGGLLH